MIYLVKSGTTPTYYVIIRAKCKSHQPFTNAWGYDKHFYYLGIEEDVGHSFDGRKIVAKTTSNSKEFARKKWSEFLI